MRRLILAGAVLGTLNMTTAFAADVIIEDVVAPPAPVVSVYDWTGFYIGAYGGGGWGDADFAFPGLGTASSTSVSGALFGGQVGYNWQTGSWVFGGEADFGWSGIDGSESCPNPAFNCDFDSNWLGTVRARVGWASNNWLIYATGGWSFIDAEYTASNAGGGGAFGPTYSDTTNGWNVGGGVEWGFYQNWSAKLEYLYHDFGDTGLPASSFGPGNPNVDLQLNTVRFGVNFRFN
jgi:outer membrane immunogenic protein